MQHAEPIHILQSDSDIQYKDVRIQQLLKRYSIVSQFSAPGVHQQNGSIERMHLTLGQRMATNFLAAPWMPIKMWYYCLNYVKLCLHVLPNPNGTNSPFMLYNKSLPVFQDLMLYPWGQPVEYFVPKERRTSKFSSHSASGAYLGPTYDP
jgi:transposase InsO family protein